MSMDMQNDVAAATKLDRHTVNQLAAFAIGLLRLMASAADLVDGLPEAILRPSRLDESAASIQGTGTRGR